MEGLVVNPAFWAGKRVLVTGNTGFKGSWLTLWLERHGAVVAGYALPAPTAPSLYEEANCSSSIHMQYGDIRDSAGLDNLAAAFRPEIVLHLAAQALVRESYCTPVETYDVNVMGTVRLLDAVRRTTGVRVVVIVTSDKCYENREWPWGYREGEALGGHDPYSSSKACAEIVTSAYRRSFFEAETARVAVASARAGNVIGGGDWARDRLIPDIVRALLAGVPVPIRNPRAIRPWQHVLEPLNGYLTLAERCWSDPAGFADSWNFGPDDADARPVEWIAETMTELWGDAAAWRSDAGPQPHEAHYLKLDASRARSLLGWRPRLDLGTALDWVVEWYKNHSAGVSARSLAIEQIARYEQRAERVES